MKLKNEHEKDRGCRFRGYKANCLLLEVSLPKTEQNKKEGKSCITWEFANEEEEEIEMKK